MTDDAHVVKVEYWYAELRRLMWAMTWDIANSERFYLEPDDVFAELSEELVKVVQHYCTKPDDEIKPLLITSLRNRCVDLQVKEYHTYRNVRILSLDENIGGIDGVTLLDVLPGADMDALYFDLDGFLAALSDDASVLVCDVLDPSDRLMMQMNLAVMRKVAISKKGLWKFGPTKNIFRRAMGWSSKRFDFAWDEVVSLLVSW